MFVFLVHDTYGTYGPMVHLRSVHSCRERLQKQSKHLAKYKFFDLRVD